MVTVSSAAASAADLAEHWLAAPGTSQSRHEARTSGRLGSLVADQAGLALALAFVDRVARPEDPTVAAAELRRLGRQATRARGFLGPLDLAMLAVGGAAAPVAPHVVVPLARARLRQLVGHLVADAGPGLGRHLAAARAAGFHLNLNLLGEAVLGEGEAARRRAGIERLVRRPDVDYVSVKTSAVATQLPHWDVDRAADRVMERLVPLYRTARDHGTFLNLDMEEYRDLELTLTVMERLAAEPSLAPMPMGVVLQAYLPDSGDALERLTALAEQRRTAGGAALKVRLVKGANLSMEKVEAQLRGWAPAPYSSKPEVDASYVALLDTAIDPARCDALRVGVASHNLFHVALAHRLAMGRGVQGSVDVEMLQGMAPVQARAVQLDVGPVLLYTPVVAREDFDVAISYLVRRLEENAAPQNFLRALVGEPGPQALEAQRAAYWESVRSAPPDRAPRRAARPPLRAATQPPTFTNVPDTDPTVPEARAWARGLVGGPAPRALADARATLVRTPTTADVDAAVLRAAQVAGTWAETSPHDRAAALRHVAVELDAARGDLVAAMMREGGKTVAEADPEVSEAVDFALYYAERTEELDRVPGARFVPSGVTVVTPPWNFPVAIPVGSTLAALGAGSPVLLKPAPATSLCGQLAGAAVARGLARAGAPAAVLQVLDCPEGDVGRALVTHPEVTRVVLTGSIDTARMFSRWRPDLDVHAETSGKNALVVTPAADLDLAVADVVRSAFGHAGQKCSAASLLILVGSAGRSARLRRQLADAVASLEVGWPEDLATAMGPLIEAPSGKLERALTRLEPGESWLVRPRALDHTGRLWSPGVRHGVAPGSFFHRTECFGPVLGVMRVETLQEAIDVQNDVDFGLTGGIHSLDEDEIRTWLGQVQVGNAYINRGTTGAIVRRQPFGGWKASSVGPGAKAGGPGYVAMMGTWADSPAVPEQPDAWLAWARDDDRRSWAEVYGVPHDPSGLEAEENVLRYRPVPHLTVREGHDAQPHHTQRVLDAAGLAGVPVTLSSARTEDDPTFAARVRSGGVRGRVRVIGTAPGLREAAAEHVGDVTVLDHPVVASGRRELLSVLREQAVSRTRHRFGHVEGRQEGPAT